MPQVRKLLPEEVRNIENKGRGRRKLIEEQYDTFLFEYDVGDYGEAELEPDEKRLTVRNRFKAAAARRGVAIEFRRTTGDTLRFKLVAGNGRSEGQTRSEAEPQEAAPASVSSDSPPAPAKKRGRPKKQTA
jgi:hypothetical protein